MNRNVNMEHSIKISLKHLELSILSLMKQPYEVVAEAISALKNQYDAIMSSNDSTPEPMTLSPVSEQKPTPTVVEASPEVVAAAVINATQTIPGQTY